MEVYYKLTETATFVVHHINRLSIRGLGFLKENALNLFDSRCRDYDYHFQGLLIIIVVIIYIYKLLSCAFRPFMYCVLTRVVLL